ncbi:hypothetical protein ACEPAI_4427 [Sanghuangporus weigelae]
MRSAKANIDDAQPRDLYDLTILDQEEDGHPNFHPKVINAIHINISDGMKVAIKKLREDSNDLATATFLTSKEL